MTSLRKTSFADRATSPSASVLGRYLLRIISIKRSNLCVSADVHTTSELLSIAEQVGDSICALKTHADIIDDFSERTIRGLQDVSRRKHFLIFEDRKFGDIGNTLQLQYARGPLRIAEWAHITNAHLLPGPSIIPSLQAAALESLTQLGQSVATTITSGATLEPTTQPTPNSTSAPYEPSKKDDEETNIVLHHEDKNSDTATTKTTTISQTVEYTSTSEPSSILQSLASASDSNDDNDNLPNTATALEELGPPPHARGLLLLAQMSSTGNLCTPEYTQTCIESAEANKDFVLGFVGQEALGQEPGQLTFCPGVSLPKEGEEGKKGDGKGQVWRTPETVVEQDGVDVIIVGRGILGADDRGREAERYRKAAWAAYEKRLSQ